MILILNSNLDFYEKFKKFHIKFNQKNFVIKHISHLIEFKAFNELSQYLKNELDEQISINLIPIKVWIGIYRIFLLQGILDEAVLILKKISNHTDIKSININELLEKLIIEYSKLSNYEDLLELSNEYNSYFILSNEKLYMKFIQILIYCQQYEIIYEHIQKQLQLETNTIVSNSNSNILLERYSIVIFCIQQYLKHNQNQFIINLFDLIWKYIPNTSNENEIRKKYIDTIHLLYSDTLQIIYSYYHSKAIVPSIVLYDVTTLIFHHYMNNIQSIVSNPSYSSNPTLNLGANPTSNLPNKILIQFISWKILRCYLCILFIDSLEIYSNIMKQSLNPKSINTNNSSVIFSLCERYNQIIYYFSLRYYCLDYIPGDEEIYHLVIKSKAYYEKLCLLSTNNSLHSPKNELNQQYEDGWEQLLQYYQELLQEKIKPSSNIFETLISELIYFQTHVKSPNKQLLLSSLQEIYSHMSIYKIKYTPKTTSLLLKYLPNDFKNQLQREILSSNPSTSFHS